MPDSRVRERQKACSKEGCQRLKKRDNNRAFSRNNPGYWCGRYEDIKAWRQRNPDYQRLPYLCEKYKVRDCKEAQKILDELISYYNDQRIHEETGEIPSKRWDDAIKDGKGKMRMLHICFPKCGKMIFTEHPVTFWLTKVDKYFNFLN